MHWQLIFYLLGELHARFKIQNSCLVSNFPSFPWSKQSRCPKTSFSKFEPKYHNRLSAILIDVVTVFYARWRFLYFTKIRILLATRNHKKIVKLCLQLSYLVQNSFQFHDIFSWKISKLQNFNFNYFDTKYPT